jgi:XTP/dITP diphosphohydrolase
LATRNAGKLREIRQVLADLTVEVVGLDAFDQIPEPSEHGASFSENARDKALAYARATDRWALADDSGLVVDALGGAPGVRSARYAADRCPPDATRDQIDTANNAKLLAELQGVPDERRTARFICHLVLADAQRVLIETSDAIEGRIAHAPRGTNGFGYDPLFIADETGCTTAELPPERKNAISHRGKALRRFTELLGDFLADSK